jgi:cytoskeleton protein RodZ
LETEQQEIRIAEGEIPQRSAPQAPQSVGTLLKTERERLGLSRGQITEKTRMRTQVIEAIEREAWDSLPPPVFVRGFLRSYAKVLGISQDIVVDLYAKQVPPAPLRLDSHLGLSKNRRPVVWLVLLILALLAAFYGMWHFYPSLQVNSGARDTKERDEKVTSAISEPAVVGSPAAAGSPGVVSSPAVASPPTVASPPPLRPAEKPTKQEPAAVQQPSQDTLPSPQRGDFSAREQAGDADGGLLLTGIVKEKTWLRITIDGKEEKEYLFQPGSKPQWRGNERFYMIIGNAGGIDFDLNGKRVADLGRSGQVIRLTLPKDMGKRERTN